MLTVIDLTPSAVTNCEATAINARGQVVGVADGIDGNGNRVSRAFLFTPPAPFVTGGMQDVGTLIADSQHPNAFLGNSKAFGINKWGQVVGVSDALDTAGLSVRRGFVWDASTGQMQDLGTLIPDLAHPGSFQGNSEARSINDRGAIVGKTDVLTGAEHAFYRDPLTHVLQDLLSLIPLGMILTHSHNSAANCINANDVVVGVSDALDAQGSPVTRAFVWNRGLPPSGGQMQDLGTFIDAQNTNQFLGDSEAFAINDSDVVVGVSDIVPLLPGMARLSFMGRLPNPMVGGLVGTLAPGLLTSLESLHAVDNTPNNPTAVGTAEVAVPQPGMAAQRGLVVSGTGSVRDLNIPALPGSWILERANGVNTSGQICGAGRTSSMLAANGPTHALLLNP